MPATLGPGRPGCHPKPIRFDRPHPKRGDARQLEAQSIVIATAEGSDRTTSPSSPPDATVAMPPTVTSLQRLPFGELTWENFERLCYRLAGLTDGVEFHSRYGRGGQAQQGIDIYVRLASGHYEVWQAKRHRQFTVADLRGAVEAFLSGSWTSRSERLVIAVQADTADRSSKRRWRAMPRH